jgi:hypothetical protein
MSPVIVVFMVTPIGQRQARFRRAVALTALTAFVGVFAWLLVVLPASLGFVLSVGSAMAWCIWIEHHPEPRDLAARVDARATAQTIMPAPPAAASPAAIDRAHPAAPRLRGRLH